MLPKAYRPFKGHHASWADIYHFITSVLYAVRDLEPVQPKPTPMEQDEEDFEDEEDPSKDEVDDRN